MGNAKRSHDARIKQSPKHTGLSLAVICLVLKVTAVEALPFNSLRREPALENI